jgi:hypothetical protein
MMVESDFNPEKGELVEMFPYDGRFEGQFEIIDKYDHFAWGPLMDVKRLRDGRIVKGVETYLLRYPKEEQVRRAIRKVLTEFDRWPDDFQRDQFGLKFNLKSDEMYDGTPRTMVYFYLKPEAVPSLDRARVWNNFYSQLEAKLEPYKDSSWDGLQFSAKEERSALSAAG